MSQVIDTTSGSKPASEKSDQTHTSASKSARAANQLILGLMFGVAFGFLLQKGGVAKYHVLIGQLLLADFTVVKVMLSAVVVGMVGIHLMERAGLVQYHLKPTRYAANVVGGLIFGAGFALSPYCPGTGAAALGQGNFDALFMVLGMLAGSYLFAEASGYLDRTLMKWGDRGQLTIGHVLHVSRGTVVAVVAPAIVLLLIVLELTTVR